MTKRDLEIGKQLIAEFRAAPGIRLELDALRAYKLVGLLQIALRHPLVERKMPWAREMVEEMVDEFSAIGPVTASTMRMGVDRAVDDGGE